MSELIDIREEQERVILVGVSVSDHDDTEESLAELKELADTAGVLTLATVIQNRERIHPGTYLGKGKIEELAEQIIELKATGIICDDELSPAQMKNLEEALDTKVMDRTMLILDIFAKHATTSEGKIQVELAQLKYRSTRLIGIHGSMAKIGYGVGMRGPGEKKLEVDRRLIRDRISQLSDELENVKRNRETTRTLRKKNATPVIALVGYTNAGKSTTLNKLTDAGVLEMDELFATLDPTTRIYELESGENILLTDTVGFIRKLPHHLIDAFGSTLEEAKYADIIVHVIDSSNPEAYKQMHVVYETLKRLGVTDKPVIAAFNKSDREGADPSIKDLAADRSVHISARTGEGLSELMGIIEEFLRESKAYLEITLPYNKGGLLQEIRNQGQLLEEEYRGDGIFVRAYVPKSVYGHVAKEVGGIKSDDQNEEY